MTVEKALATVGDFFEVHQTHYAARVSVESGVDVSALDLEAFEAGIQEVIEDLGEGSIPFTRDPVEVLEQLQEQIDTAAEDPLDEVGKQTPEQVVAEAKDAVSRLGESVVVAAFWNTGSDEESRFSFRVYLEAGHHLQLDLGYD